MATERSTRNSGKLPKWTAADLETIVRPENRRPRTDREIAEMVSASLPHGEGVTPESVRQLRVRLKVSPGHGQGHGWASVNAVYWFPLSPYDATRELGIFYSRLRLAARGKEMSREERELMARRKTELLAMVDPKDGIEKRWVLCYSRDRKPGGRIYAHPWRDGDGDSFVCQHHNPSKMVA